jgi:tetratricopeptide (TPR) repeat protein
MGLICHEAGRLDTAAAGFRAAYEKGFKPRDGEEARWSYSLYEQYRDAGKYDDALWVCDYLLKSNDKNEESAKAQALNLRAEILYDYKDDVKAAADACKRVMVECSTARTDFVRSAYIRLGEYALVRGDRPLARKSLEEVERAEKWRKWAGDIEISEGVNELNFTQYLRAGELDAAMQEVRSLEWKTPTIILSGLPRYLRGKVFLARRQYALALREFERALTMDRQASFAAEAVYAKGMAYDGLKESDNARVCFQKVLKEFPESSVAADAREKLK